MRPTLFLPLIALPALLCPALVLAALTRPAQAELSYLGDPVFETVTCAGVEASLMVNVRSHLQPVLSVGRRAIALAEGPAWTGLFCMPWRGRIFIGYVESMRPRTFAPPLAATARSDASRRRKVADRRPAIDLRLCATEVGGQAETGAAAPMTPEFEAFIAPARRRPAIWRLLLGLAVIAAVYLGGLGAILLALGRFGERLGIALSLLDIGLGQDASAMLLLLGSFGGLALGSILAALLLHRRGPGSLIGPAGPVARDFLVAVASVAVIYALVLLPWSYRFDAVPNLPLSTWAKLLPLALAGVALQTLAEEITFRGYLMQQLAARFRSPLVWMLLPALAFGALHWNPLGTGANAFVVIGAVGLFALAAADLTRRSGRLGAAWGMHFANNCIALLVLATGDTLPGLARWRTPYAASDPAMAWAVAGDLLAIALTWALLAHWLNRQNRAAAAEA